MKSFLLKAILPIFGFLFFVSFADASLSLTAGSNATTTPNVATSITGFQIVGPSASTTPVRLRATHGTLSMTTTTGLTFSGSSSGSTINFSGTVANINSALATLKYTRASVGTDTLEVSLVEAGEVFFPGNGHLYKFVAGGYTWDQAKTASESQTAYGAVGYLATITSPDENNFVYSRITGNGWIGATDIQTEKTWRWVTGPEAGTAFFQENPSGGGGSAIGGLFNAWYQGEPNDYNNGNPGEDCAHMYSSGGQAGTWNDFPCNSSLGYVVEFGGNTEESKPTVVAKNISIVTADVPAVTVLSPSNGSQSVHPGSNLVITFSKQVTKQTGNIVIHKSSDDSVFESIDVSGDLINGSGTNTITINPSADLDEGEGYYVIVPSTAFMDSSDNNFAGITSPSTWSFITTDVTPPSILNLNLDIFATSTNVTWDTDEIASTRVFYSMDNSFSVSSSELNTNPRVLTHSMEISNLVSCTFYNLAVVSKDGFNNTSTSTTHFVTSGCLGDSYPYSHSSTNVTVSNPATSTLSDRGRTFNVETPPDFTATSSSVVIQIKSLNSNSVLGSIGIPSSLNSAASVVFDVKALVDNTIELDSFDMPVTVSYAYTDEDIEGLDESTLSMYHYSNGSWTELDNCVLNTSENIITCHAPHFSIFAIFGSPIVVVSQVSSSGGGSLPWCSGPTAPGWNTSLPDGGCLGKTIASAQTQTTSSNVLNTQNSCPKYNFTRILKFGDRGEDVKNLQKLMNCLGFILATEGPGSPGNETTFFVGRTKASVTQFQEKYSQEILAPLKLTKGTGIFAQMSIKKSQEL